METITAAEMRALEQEAIASGRVTGLELMERAGRGVVEAILEEWPELESAERGASPSRSPGYLETREDQGAPRAVVLCGPGNNGGDGFVVARLLHGRGWKVEVFFYGDPERLPPDALENYQRWNAIGQSVPWDDAAIAQSWDYDWPQEPRYVVIDALFGIGMSREMPADTENVWRALMPAGLNDPRDHPQSDLFVAVDIPSGIHSDTGENFGPWASHLTVTFHKLKPGHLMGDRVGYCGKVVVKDIGL
ncbi:NAD(P)HX epimerase [Candidatus Rhodobacter oscarellae]|uniref:NAD(P)H-hydrate epimerase n=1 Tax=Candidatus Rhodobacter oscarellae TaxID=1675527 RepID=A0A0J9ECQ1_9RHOB|nr:NAD(P)H-hydrate epimerase [Candidatus Rhodobacter lobularis]KMW60446.1 NAD(P)HX epimerase [Candidatus Rhodobacter lobularis]